MRIQIYQYCKNIYKIKLQKHQCASNVPVLVVIVVRHNCFALIFSRLQLLGIGV